MPRRPPSLSKLANPPTRTPQMSDDNDMPEGGDHALSDPMRGQGAAIQMTEIEKLRLRVAELEKSRPPVTAPAATRLVPLGAGFRDAQGRPIMVPASGGESLGDRLVRKQFADIGRDAFERDEAIRAIGQEV